MLFPPWFWLVVPKNMLPFASNTSDTTPDPPEMMTLLIKHSTVSLPVQLGVVPEVAASAAYVPFTYGIFTTWELYERPI